MKKGDQIVIVGTIKEVYDTKSEVVRSKSANDKYRTNYDSIDWKKGSATLN